MRLWGNTIVSGSSVVREIAGPVMMILRPAFAAVSLVSKLAITSVLGVGRYNKLLETSQ